MNIQTCIKRTMVRQLQFLRQAAQTKCDRKRDKVTVRAEATGVVDMGYKLGAFSEDVAEVLYDWIWSGDWA